MKTIKIWNDSPSDKQVEEIASALEAGEVVVMPTDTLYALTCDSLNPKAIERICRLKGINPEKEQLSIICADISMAAEYSRFDNYAFRLLKELTPGPFTFICRTAPLLPKAFKNRKTVGVRIPDCETCRRVAERLGRPLMTTSVEFETDDYALDPELIAENYESKADLAILGERGGLESSTILDCTGREAEIVREGKGADLLDDLV